MTTTPAPSPYLPVRDDWLARRTEPILEPDRPIIDPHHHLWERPDWRDVLEAHIRAGGDRFRGMRQSQPLIRMPIPPSFTTTIGQAASAQMDFDHAVNSSSRRASRRSAPLAACSRATSRLTRDRMATRCSGTPANGWRPVPARRRKPICSAARPRASIVWSFSRGLRCER
jgi:hypothetical protein